MSTFGTWLRWKGTRSSDGAAGVHQTKKVGELYTDCTKRKEIFHFAAVHNEGQ